MTVDAWKVCDSRYVLEDQWIRVRADECTTPSGVEISPYYILEFPDFVHILAIDDQDRVVLVRQYRHGLRNLSIELPGGVMDASDHEILTTAKRELQEETGYIGNQYTHITTLSVDPARYENRLHLVGAHGITPGVGNPEPSENIDVILVPRSEVIQLALSGKIMNSQHVGLLMIGLFEGK